jgi:hypothetical protein
MTRETHLGLAIQREAIQTPLHHWSCGHNAGRRRGCRTAGGTGVDVELFPQYKMAEFERAQMQERVRSGLQSTRAAGKQISCQRRALSYDQLLHLKAQGTSPQEIATKGGIGYRKIRMRLASTICL